MTTLPLLCPIDAIKDGGALAIDVAAGGETLELVLLRRGNAVHGYHNVCPHAGRRLDYAPGQFLVRDGRLICAAHGASFDVASGTCVGGPGGGGLRRVGLHRDGDQVCLDEPPSQAG